jgi:putative transposase
MIVVSISSFLLTFNTIGASVMWDGKGWMIVNDGNKNISLMATNGDLIELPRNTFEGLIKVGKITSLDKPQLPSASAEEVQKILASDKTDLKEALKRYTAIKPYLEGRLPEEETISDRTIRYWKAKYRESELTHGNGFIGLLSQHLSRGNRKQKLPKGMPEFIDEFISENYETLKQQSLIAVFRNLQEKCKKDGKLAPSYKTFTRRVKMRDAYQQKRKRKGDKAAKSVLAADRSGSKASQKREHALNCREFDERLGTGREPLIIAC